MTDIILPTIDEGGFAGTEYFSKRIIGGDAEAARANVFYALEKLSYQVVSRQPLVAKNNVSNSAAQGKLVGGNILNSPVKLTVELHASTADSTHASFNYAILNSAITKGDRQTLEREIDAVVALAASRTASAMCPACGASNDAEARFCRVCGIPNSVREPAELEVLRLTANARAAYQTMLGGIIFTVCWLTFVVALWLLSHQTLMAALIILGGGAAFGSLWTMRGMLRLHRTLNPPAAEKESSAANTKTPSILLENNQTAALPPQEISQTSITECTTELLPGFQKENELPKAVHKVSDTNPELFK